MSNAGEHRLLTAEASSGEPHGVALARVFDVIQAEHPERLLLLVDACRRQPRPDVPWAVSAAWQPRVPSTFLENVELKVPYAVLASAGPGGFAQSDATVRNGYFTRAVIDGLGCKASSLPDGWVTLSNLADYVSNRVRELSNDYQQTESRIGGLGGLRLIFCADTPPVATILSPAKGAVVGPHGYVTFRVHRPELFATVLVCAAYNNVCFNQNPGAEPIATRAGEAIEISVQYGTPGRFAIHVALTTDPQFLHGEHEWPYVPRRREANSVVHWYGPIDVSFK